MRGFEGLNSDYPLLAYMLWLSRISVLLFFFNLSIDILFYQPTFVWQIIYKYSQIFARIFAHNSILHLRPSIWYILSPEVHFSECPIMT